MDHDETVRLYGPWKRRTPGDVAKLLRGYPGRWWVAGGWAIEAFTGEPREHGDLDVGVPRSEVALLRRHLAGRLDVWAADRGSLSPVVGEDAVILPTCGNLWLRASGADAWEYDVLLTDVTSAGWSYRRDARVTLPVERVVWRRDGLAYLRPEVQLLYKAPGLRPQDQRDFEACQGRLGGEARAWLRMALETAHRGHPWIAALV